MIMKEIWCCGKLGAHLQDSKACGILHLFLHISYFDLVFTWMLLHLFIMDSFLLVCCVFPTVCNLCPLVRKHFNKKLSRNNQQDAALYKNLLFHHSLTNQHVSSSILLIISCSAVVKSERELDYGRAPHAYVNQRLQIQLELLMMGGMLLETC